LFQTKSIIVPVLDPFLFPDKIQNKPNKNNEINILAYFKRHALSGHDGANIDPKNNGNSLGRLIQAFLAISLISAYYILKQNCKIYYLLFVKPFLKSLQSS